MDEFDIIKIVAGMLVIGLVISLCGAVFGWHIIVALGITMMIMGIIIETLVFLND